MRPLFHEINSGQAPHNDRILCHFDHFVLACPEHSRRAQCRPFDYLRTGSGRNLSLSKMSRGWKPPLQSAFEPPGRFLFNCNIFILCLPLKIDKELNEVSYCKCPKSRCVT